MNQQIMERGLAQSVNLPLFNGKNNATQNPLGFCRYKRAATCMEVRDSNSSGVRECNAVPMWLFRMVIFIAVLLAGSMIGGNFAYAYSGGNGTLVSPYKIASASDFRQIPDNSTAYYVLVNDITNVAPLNITFKGHLDGQGHSIFVEISKTNSYGENYQLYGLFERCINATIDNILINGSLSFTADIKRSNSCSEYVSVGYVTNWQGYAQWLKLYKIKGDVGGIAASAQSSSFTNCKVAVNITWETKSDFTSGSTSTTTDECISDGCSIGGLVGKASECDFQSCEFTGKIYTSLLNSTYSFYAYIASDLPSFDRNNVGGIVGCAMNSEIVNVCSSGSISDYKRNAFIPRASVGGLMGYSENSTIRTSYFSGQVDVSYGNSGVISGLGKISAYQCFSPITDLDLHLFAGTSGVFKDCYTANEAIAELSSEKKVSRSLLSMRSWYNQNMPDWDFDKIWYLPATEDSLPLYSIEPKIGYNGVLTYGESIDFNSQNLNKVLKIEVEDTESAEINNNTVTFKKAGDVKLILSQDSYDKYRKVSKDITLNVSKRDLNISVKNSESIYGDEIPEFILQYEGFIYNDDANCLTVLPSTLCDASPSHNIGDYPIVLQGGESDNYIISLKNGIHKILPRILTATPQNYTRKYGSSNPTFQIAYEGFANGDNENIVISRPNINTTADRYSDTGVYSLLCNGGSVSSNYKLEYGVGQLTIEKANLNISALDTKREFGQSNPKFELAFDGFRNNDDITDLDELPLISCDANIASEPGVYPIMLSGGGDNNYEYILKDGQLIVIEKESIILIQSILLNPDSWVGMPGETFQIIAEIIPENATNKVLNWISNNENIAKVDENGNITAISEGTCVITVSSTDGSNVSNQCEVVITTNTSSIDIFSDSAIVDVYNIQGNLIKKNVDRTFIDQLNHGIYIIRQGKISKKIII